MLHILRHIHLIVIKLHIGQLNMKRLLLALLVLVSASANAQVHWTGTIEYITVKSDGSGYIFINSPVGPNPANSTWGCSSDVVHLGAKGSPVQPAFLSQALAAYTTKRIIRLGVTGSGDDCETQYITAK